ncbi:hypothetical protein BDZ97DRAFT_1993904 [Flammula alnicola]|nr:hypothetical protein BDZ97DRAFT_1993904 [Flammula alnicola]
MNSQASEECTDPALPPELLRLILENLKDDFPSLFSTSLVNRVFNDESQRLLYRSIHILLGPNSRGKHPLRTVLNNLSLARYVHKFRLEEPEYNIIFDYPALVETLQSNHVQNQVARFQQLQGGLRSMVNLKELSIETDKVDRWKVLNDFAGSGAPQLDKFRWMGNKPLSSSSSLQELSAFLARQPRLRQLETELNNRVSKERLPLPICADLQVLMGNRGAVEAILPGRKVSVLVWKPGHLSKELRALKVLSLHYLGWFGSMAPVHEMAKHLHTLRYLELHNYNLESISEWIFEIPSLVGLVVADDRNRRRYADTSLRKSKVDYFFEICPTLQFVAIELSASFKVPSRNFEWWSRVASLSDDPNEPEYRRYSTIEKIIYSPG